MRINSKVIAIGTDESILDNKSRSFERVRDYASICEEYIVLIFTKNKSAKVIEDGNFKVVPIVGANKLVQVWKLFRYFNLSTFREGGQILSSQDAFEIGFLSYLIAKKYGFKLLVQMHTDISTKFFRQESLRNFFQLLLALFVLRKAEKIRVVSDKMKIYLEVKLKIKSNNIFLLPIYTDVSRYKFKTPSNSPLVRGRTQILMISRIEEVKNIPLGIKAVQAYRKISGLDVKLKIVGHGNLKQKYLKQFKGSVWIEWADWTENVQAEYHNADLLLITSNYEGWGLTAVESVACGTPVAISPVGVANEFIVDGINGYVARGHDVINIMEAIYNCLTHEFDSELMQSTLLKLNNKETYLAKLKLLLS